MSSNSINLLEKDLGIYFNDKKLLEVALTHSSYANQYKNIEYNERLEFLGDAVLQLCVTEYLFNKYHDKSEGDLTKIRALIVCESSLFEIAKKLNLAPYIRMSKGEEYTGGRERASLLADCVEAFIAALYLDKGKMFAYDFIIGHFNEIIKKAINKEIVLDFKTKLQELLQKNGEIDICYTLEKYEGPPHRRKFFTKVTINDETLGHGEGYSKKEAEQNAAKSALELLSEEENG